MRPPAIEVPTGEPEKESEFVKKRRAFFIDLGLAHLPEMRVLLTGGKLTKRDKWRNVAEHSMTEMAAVAVLAEQLGLSGSDTERLIKAAGCHDWEKRLEKRPADFSPEERAAAEQLLAEAAPDRMLVNATKMEWLERAVVEKKADFLERLLFYVDDICRESEIVPLDERIDEAEAREGNLGASTELEQRLGGRYRDKERELGHAIEREVQDRLAARGVSISSPELLPTFIKETLLAKINEHSA